MTQSSSDPLDAAVGPLAVSVLALLAESPATLAEVREQLVSRRQDRIVAWDEDALAAEVETLAAAGQVARDGDRLHLTDAGREALIGWTAATLARHEPERPAFDLALLTAHAVPPAVAREALARRLTELDDITGQLTTRIRTSARRGLSEAYGMQADYRRTLLVAEFRWLSRLLERMDSGELTWDVDECPAAAPETA